MREGVGTVLTLDGGMGEGGGQILRSALGLSLVTGTPFRIDNIRANRNKPGLLRQHLTAVQAATQIGAARIEGAEIGSRQLTFAPSEIRAGDYHFAIGTAGSTTLVLQSVLPALLIAPGPTRVVIEGGTHNPFAPPYDFLGLAFLPLLTRMGARIGIELERPGFYPAGGGRICVVVQPTGGRGLQPLHLTERGPSHRRRAVAMIANLPDNIARRELRVVQKKLDLSEGELELSRMDDSAGPGNLLTIALTYENVTEVFTGFGQHGKRAEHVAGEAVHAAKQYLATDAPIGRHLADQLLIPIAMAGKGSFRALPLSRHTKTNIEVIRRFLPVRIDHCQDDRVAHVDVDIET